MAQNKKFHPIVWALNVKEADIVTLVASAREERQRLMQEIVRMQQQVRDLSMAIDKHGKVDETSTDTVNLDKE